MARLLLRFVVKLLLTSSIILHCNATGTTTRRSSGIFSTAFVAPPVPRLFNIFPAEKPNSNLKSKLDLRTNNINPEEQKQGMKMYDKNNRIKREQQDHDACLTTLRITSAPANKERTIKQKVVRGLITAPALITAPFYAIGFGLVGYNKMWLLSEWIYKFSKPTERYLHHHFDGIQKYLRKPLDSKNRNNKNAKSQQLVKKRKSLGYVIHPTFAGLSLITTFTLAFVSPSKIRTTITYQKLLLTNLLICTISTVAAIPLINTMLGNRKTKKWTKIQGNLAVIFAALSLLQGNIGSLFVHLNWSLLFAGGVLERFYVLCILSQFDTPNMKTYVKYYSPQLKIATLGSIPMGLVTYFFSL